ncbi:hypothetical protein Lgra_0266 [Legionella gratiana]|uniref:Transmembrane protein n=1 Tax=Legionella gratiana TaxID=45066 RepID=A0A378JCF4_9GAMM|nr:hypothetical protein [Legionella gratiana]KTD15600.1 hypothetical protein Lgra_0266 [Legionella gratiana]STX45006.1 Uncharacterised protein [Legionella gratiana]
MVKKLFILLGWIGTLIILFGTTQKPSHVYYIAGALALLSTAIYYKLFFYVALELILIAGHLAIFLRIGPYTQLFLPILLCAQLLTFYIVFGKVKIFLVLGILGVAFLSIGLAYNNQWIFFSGSTFIAIYSYYAGHKGQHPAYIWAGLNTALALIALSRILIF